MLPEVQEPEENHEEYYQEYFGNDAGYYLEKLEQYRRGIRFTFNIGAFFLGVFWLLYRKMYLFAGLAVVVVTASSLLLETVLKSNAVPANNALLWNNGLTIFWSILLGFTGNWLYLKQAQKHVQKALRDERNETEALLQLRAQGSTTLMPHIYFAAIILVFLLLN
jgi:hypothetical protein